MATRYDRYWRDRDAARTRARSEARAELALDLLRRDGAVRAASGDRRPRLLEIGCGPGWALERFARAGYEARGIDVSEVAAEAARSRGLAVERRDIEEDDLEGRYEVVALLEVLEHLVEPLRALAKARGVLEGGGRLVVSLPNEFHVLRRLAVVAGRPSFGGHEDPHLRYFDDRSARRLFDAAGLRVLGRASDSVVPPRRRLLKSLAAPAAKVVPGLLAISNVYLLAEPAPPGGGRP